MDGHGRPLGWNHTAMEAAMLCWHRMGSPSRMPEDNGTPALVNGAMTCGPRHDGGRKELLVSSGPRSILLQYNHGMLSFFFNCMLSLWKMSSGPKKRNKSGKGHQCHSKMRHLDTVLSARGGQ